MNQVELERSLRTLRLGGMAQSLEMSTPAEGVETAEQAQMIRDMGCTKIQGYYFGRPMAPTDAHSLVVKRRAAA